MFSDNPRLSRVLRLALPIIGGMMSQNILKVVDTAMVGQLGDAALAAVGMGGFAAFMSMALKEPLRVLSVLLLLRTFTTFRWRARTPTLPRVTWFTIAKH